MLAVNNKNKIEEMFKAGLHYGYSRSRRHPKMSRYLFGLKNNIEIFDLEKTNQKLEEAKEFLKGLAKDNKKILFVGTKVEAKKLIEEFANKIGMPYVNKRWLGGTITNFKTIRERVNGLEDLIKKKELGELEKYTKKEKMQIEEKISELKKIFGGLETLSTLPSALLIIDTHKEKNALKEAKKAVIPTVAIMNTNCNPEEVDYPIPANTNSKSSIEYILEELARAYQEGQKNDHN